MGSHEELRNQYQIRGLVLCLGSGISKRSGLPDWIELLNRLFHRAWPTAPHTPQHPLFDQLRQDGFTLTAIASILEQKLGVDFVDNVREALYRDFCLFVDPPEVPDRSLLVKQVQTENQSLRAVAALCVVKNQDSYVANPKIRAIVNLNFDVVFRTYAKERYGKHLLRTVERPDAQPYQGSIPTYHAHGLLHWYHKRINKPKYESPDFLIFTEQQYFDFFGRPFEVFSYTLLSLMREYSMVFIGTALKDDNLRRLLYYNQKERALAAERQPDANIKLAPHFLFTTRSGNKDVDELTATAHLRLGVNTIWLNNWSELPIHLQSTYESTYETTYETTGARWADVF
jgi:hypothetical protein